MNDFADLHVYVACHVSRPTRTRRNIQCGRVHPKGMVGWGNNADRAVTNVHSWRPGVPVSPVLCMHHFVELTVTATASGHASGINISTTYCALQWHQHLHNLLCSPRHCQHQPHDTHSTCHTHAIGCARRSTIVIQLAVLVPQMFWHRRGCVGRNESKKLTW